MPLATPTTVEQYYVQARISHLLPGTDLLLRRRARRLRPGRPPRAGPGPRRSPPRPRRGTAFTFTAFGDQGETYDAVATGNLVRSQNPAFHLHAGDLSYANDGGSGQITDSYDPRVWDSFLAQNEAFASAVPWQAVVGNHEMEPWYSPDGYGGFFQRFAQPTQNQAYYSFTYGNVGVPGPGRQRRHLRVHGQPRLQRRRSDQAGWPASSPRSARTRTSTSSSRTSTSAPTAPPTSTPPTAVSARHWTPLFDQYSVDLVINGHNHVYERTDPLKAGAVTTAAPIGATVDAGHPRHHLRGRRQRGQQPVPVHRRPDSYEGDVDNHASVTTWVRNSSGGRRRRPWTGPGSATPATRC